MTYYQDLGEEGDLRFAWSNDGTRVVFNDRWNNLWLMGLDGTVRQLAADLSCVDYDSFYDMRLFWSPDNSRLLVLSAGNRAWVLFLTE